MKKSLIALAVLAASGAAMAQSSVSIYGIADVWVGKTSLKASNIDVTDLVDATEPVVLNGKVSKTGLESGGWDTSRIGFRGTEDLGGGLKANFQIETSIALDAPDKTTLGDRTAYVGLAGGFGEVQLGKNWTAYDDVWGAHNNNFDSAFTARPGFIGYTANPNNTIKYISPSFGGFSGALSYSLGEDKATSASKASSVLALNVAYANGPVSVAFGHQSEKIGSDSSKYGVDISNALINTANEFLDTPIETAFETGEKITSNQISGSYDLGVVKLLAVYNQSKLKFVDGGADKSTDYSFGVEVPVSANLAVSAGYGQSKLKFDAEEVAKAKSFGFAAVYTLSKRTSAYAGYSQTKYTSPVVTGNIKSSLYAVGVRHAF